MMLAVLAMQGPAYGGQLEDGLAARARGDYAQAFLLLAPLAEAGEREAAYVLGEMYRKGQGLVPSPGEALPLLTRAAEAGQVEAQIALGEMYETGEGVSQDFDTALAWLRRAAESGNPRGQFSLGLHHIRVEDHRDFAEAARWMRRAAEQGLAEAQYFLARLLLDGRGVEADGDQARFWFEQAARQQHVKAQRFVRVLALADDADRALALRELRRQLAAGVAELAGVSVDAGYGRKPEAPIRAGQDYPAQWAYLNALRGPEGQVVHYRSLGPCCFFRHPDGARGKAFLDRYELTYDGLSEPAILYFTLFAHDVLLEAPAGFTLHRGDGN